MSQKMLEYKGYLGSYEITEDNTFFGKVEFIRDLISYEGESAKEIKSAFQEAIDDYLDTCSASGKSPDRPFKGSFNVRIGEDLHRKLAMSLKENETINSFVKEAIKKAVS